MRYCSRSVCVGASPVIHWAGCFSRWWRCYCLAVSERTTHGSATGSVEAVILLVLAVFWLVFVASQVLSWRRTSGERRQQLKWLMRRLVRVWSASTGRLTVCEGGLRCRSCD